MPTNPKTSKASDDAEHLRGLLGRSYSQDLKAYTQSIQTRPDKVMQLEEVYSELMGRDDPTADWFPTQEQDELFKRAMESQAHLDEPPRDSWRLFGLSQAAIVVA